MSPPRSRRASHWAFLFVLTVGGTVFLWWFRSRPSALLYQLQSKKSFVDQPAVIARYQKRLQRKNLTKEEEIRSRLALAEFYLRTSAEEGTVLLGGNSGWSRVDPTFDDKAREQLNRVFELDPDEPEAHYLLGRLLLRTGLAHYAVEELKKSVEIRPTFTPSLLYLSRVYLERLEPDHAKEIALQALAVDPQSDAARWMLVLADIDLGQFWKAQDAYHELSPSFRSRPRIRSFFAVHLADQNRWGEADKEMERAVASNPEDVFVRVDQARLLLKKGLWDEALGVLRVAEALEPRSPWPKLYASEASSQRGDCGDPQRTGRLLTGALPRWPYSYWPEAWARLCRNNADEALQSLRTALDLSPYYFDAARLESRILLDMGRYEALGNLLRPWLDRQSHQSEVHALLARSFLDQSKAGLGRQMAEEAIRLDPRNAEGYVWLGFARLMEKDKDGARRSFRTALQLNPYSDRALGGRAFLLASDGRLEKARDLLSSKLQEKPNSAELWFIKGRIEARDGVRTEAEQAFRRVIDIKPYYLKPYLELISLLWEDGNTGEIRPLLQRVSRINPNDPAVLAWKWKVNQS